MDLYIIKTWFDAKFARNEEGASMIEYALLVGLIAVVAVLAVTALGTKVSGKFSSANASL